MARHKWLVSCMEIKSDIAWTTATRPGWFEEPSQEGAATILRWENVEFRPTALRASTARGAVPGLVRQGEADAGAMTGGLTAS